MRGAQQESCESHLSLFKIYKFSLDEINIFNKHFSNELFEFINRYIRFKSFKVLLNFMIDIYKQLENVSMNYVFNNLSTFDHVVFYVKLINNNLDFYANKSFIDDIINKLDSAEIMDISNKNMSEEFLFELIEKIYRKNVLVDDGFILSMISGFNSIKNNIFVNDDNYIRFNKYKDFLKNNEELRNKYSGAIFIYDIYTSPSNHEEMNIFLKGIATEFFISSDNDSKHVDYSNSLNCIVKDFNENIKLTNNSYDHIIVLSMEIKNHDSLNFLQKNFIGSEKINNDIDVEEFKKFIEIKNKYSVLYCDISKIEDKRAVIKLILDIDIILNETSSLLDYSSALIRLGDVKKRLPDFVCDELFKQMNPKYSNIDSYLEDNKKSNVLNVIKREVLKSSENKNKIISDVKSCHSLSVLIKFYTLLKRDSFQYLSELSYFQTSTYYTFHEGACQRCSKTRIFHEVNRCEF